VVHPLAGAESLKDLRLLVLTVGGDDDRDRLPDCLVGGPPKEALRTTIPRFNDAVEALTDDGVVAGFDDSGQLRCASICVG
jgi:hypothetical protein